MIAYYDVEKDRPGEGLPSRREAEDARLQGGDSGRNRHEHDRRRIPADDVHGQGGRKDARSLRPAAAPAGSGPAQRELARSEGDSQGDERRLPGGSDRAHERFVEGFRILDRDRPGRDPRENPEGREAFEEVVSFLSGCRRPFNPVFGTIRKGRDPDRILHEGAAFVWTVLLGAFLRCGSRNRMDARRDDRRYAPSVLRLAGQDWWVRNSEFTTPCTEGCCSYLKRGCTSALETALVDQVRYPVRGRYFDTAKLRGDLVIALDGSKQEKIRNCRFDGRRKLRYVLEAKIITPWGWAISAMSEPIRPWRGDVEKQDCEYHGSVRLAKRLKAAFPKLGIYIVGDSLYACSSVMRICDDYNRDCIFTFKEGRTPKAYADAHELMEAFPKDGGRIVRHNAHGKPCDGGKASWANGVEIDGPGRDPIAFNVVKVEAADAEDSDEATYSGQFATSLGVESVGRAVEVVQFGRGRWNIENNFKVEKHDGFGPGHNFCNKARASRNFCLLMQIANNLWQVFNLGHLARLQKLHRKVPQKEWVEIIR